MRVYFCDESISDVFGHLPKTLPMALRNGQEASHLTMIDAGSGYSKCIFMAETCKKINMAVVTNCTALLNSDYCWDEDKQRFDCYFYDKENKEWRNIHTLTDKDLRKAHNIEKMFRAGSFMGEVK